MAWQLRTGRKALTCCSRLILLISAVTLMSSLLPTICAAAQTKNSDIPKTQMTEEQQSKLLQLTALGLQWVRGDIEFSEVERYLGKPKLRSDQLGRVEYFYFPDNIMRITFTWYRNDSDELHEPRLGDFNIKIDDKIETNIPYETFDTIGLNRVQRGARIDASHVEKRDFFAPIGVLEMTNALPINSVSFLYSQLMPENSPYDIYAGFNYLADLFRETGPWDLSIVRKAVNLREVSIARISRYP